MMRFNIDLILFRHLALPIALMVACCANPSLAGAEVDAGAFPVPPFNPPDGHPRLMLSSQDLPALRTNMLKPQNALAYAAYTASLQLSVDGGLRPVEGGKAGNFDNGVLSHLECRALSFVLDGNAEHGRQAIDAIIKNLRTVSPTDYNEIGQTIFTTSLIYDWCYPLVTGEEKVRLHKSVIDLAEKLEIGWPPIKLGPVIGHGPEGQFFRDLMGASIAFFDEDPLMWRMVGGRFFGEFIAPKVWMYSAHMHMQGCHYANYRGQWELLANGIFRRMGHPDIFGSEQKYFLDWILYARRPDGQTLRDGDTHINNGAVGDYYRAAYRSLLLASGLFKDPYYKAEAARQRPGYPPKMDAAKNQTMNPVEILLFNDPELEPRSLSELPLSKYFPSPKGAFIARTGWQDGMDSPAVVVECKINEWTTINHQHLDAGAFQIYYKGSLAIDSGYYQSARDKTWSSEIDGSSGYGSLHDYNYNKRTIAHNCLLVVDPEESFKPEYHSDTRVLANDGGQRWPNANMAIYEKFGKRMDTFEYFMDPRNEFRTGRVLAAEVGGDPSAPDFTYLAGDLSPAYSSKVKAYDRSFQFMNLHDLKHPAVLVVFDRVQSANADFKKIWLLHSLEKPSIAGSRFSLCDSREGYGGRLVVDTILPLADNCEIQAVGGEGREFLVGEVNYRAEVRTSPWGAPTGGTIINEGGKWRVEVSPRRSAAGDLFLHVLQVDDGKMDTDLLAVERIETLHQVGVRIHDRIALFGKAGGRSSEPISLTVTGDAICALTIADVTAGSWSIARNGVREQEVHVTVMGGILSCLCGPGEYIVSYTAGSTPPIAISPALQAATYPKEFALGRPR
jgi:Heparinase II C-terminal domain/Heparinase II/III-like protein